MKMKTMKECKHNNVVLIKTEDRNDDTLKHTYECDRCDRQTIYIYELKKCYDVKGKNEMEYKPVPMSFEGFVMK